MSKGRDDSRDEKVRDWLHKVSNDSTDVAVPGGETAVGFSLLRSDDESYQRHFTLFAGADPEETIVIGRAPESRVEVPLVGVSSIHCELRLHYDGDAGPKLCVRDLSVNGTGMKFPSGRKMILKKGVDELVPDGTELLLPMKVSKAARGMQEVPRMWITVKLDHVAEKPPRGPASPLANGVTASDKHLSDVNAAAKGAGTVAKERRRRKRSREGDKKEKSSKKRCEEEAAPSSRLRPAVTEGPAAATAAAGPVAADTQTTAPGTPPGQPPPPEPGTRWTVWVDRSLGSKLGININTSTLLIDRIAERGLIASWNQASPASAVRMGDYIMSVNGETSPELAIGECKKEQMLKFTFLRVADVTQDAAESGAPAEIAAPTPSVPVALPVAETTLAPPQEVAKPAPPPPPLPVPPPPQRPPLPPRERASWGNSLESEVLSPLSIPPQVSVPAVSEPPPSFGALASSLVAPWAQGFMTGAPPMQAGPTIAHPPPGWGTSQSTMAAPAVAAPMTLPPQVVPQITSPVAVAPVTSWDVGAPMHKPTSPQLQPAAMMGAPAPVNTGSAFPGREIAPETPLPGLLAATPQPQAAGEPTSFRIQAARAILFAAQNAAVADSLSMLQRVPPLPAVPSMLPLQFSPQAPLAIIPEAQSVPAVSPDPHVINAASQELQNITLASSRSQGVDAVIPELQATTPAIRATTSKAGPLSPSRASASHGGDPHIPTMMMKAKSFEPAMKPPPPQPPHILGTATGMPPPPRGRGQPLAPAPLAKRPSAMGKWAPPQKASSSVHLAGEMAEMIRNGRNLAMAEMVAPRTKSAPYTPFPMPPPLKVASVADGDPPSHKTSSNEDVGHQDRRSRSRSPRGASDESRLRTGDKWGSSREYEQVAQTGGAPDASLEQVSEPWFALAAHKESAEAPKAGRPAAKKSAPAAKKSGGLRLGGPPVPAAGNMQRTGIRSKAAPSATLAGDAWSEGDSGGADWAGVVWNAKLAAASVESGADHDNRDPLANFHRQRPGAAEDVHSGKPAVNSWSSADWDWKANWK